MTENALVMIMQRNAFFKRLHYLVLMAFFLCVAVIVGLFAVIYFLATNPNYPVYFATDKVTRLIDVVPLNQPNMTDDDLITWMVNAVQQAYSYDYINFRTQLQNAQNYFTEYGWNNYMEGLTATNNLLAVTQRRMISIANVVEKPILVTKGILGGAYAWKYRIPLLVAYSVPPYDDKSRFYNALQLEVIVQRRPILQSRDGVGIVQMIGQFATSPNSTQEITNTPGS